MSFGTDYRENPLARTKIIATVGPACETREALRDLILRGVSDELHEVRCDKAEPLEREGGRPGSVEGSSQKPAHTGPIFSNGDGWRERAAKDLQLP